MKIICLNLLLAIAIVSFEACKSNNKKSYAIRDFSETLQPYLTKAVTTLIIHSNDAGTLIKEKATDEELINLTQSEHPELRAIAFEGILDRPKLDYFNLLMSHLDDTAIITTDEGEWGYDFITVSDYIIKQTKWKNAKNKEAVIEDIILHHNHLKSAYIILPYIKLKEEYYEVIKNMTSQYRPFEEIECALYALAKFKSLTILL